MVSWTYAISFSYLFWGFGRIKLMESFAGQPMNALKSINWVALLILVLKVKEAVSMYRCHNFFSCSIYTLKIWFKVL